MRSTRGVMVPGSPSTTNTVRAFHQPLDAFGACPICQRQDPAIEIGFDDVAEPIERRRIHVVAAVTPSEIARFADARLALATPLHPGARELVEEFYGEPHWRRPTPGEIGLKENVAVVAASRLLHARVEDVELEISHHIRSATDVLRLAAAFGGSDPSLGDKKPVRLSNAHRRIVLDQLDIAPETIEKPGAAIERRCTPPGPIRRALRTG